MFKLAFKKIFCCFLLLLLLIMPSFYLLNALPRLLFITQATVVDQVITGTLFQSMNSFIREQIPFRRQFSQLGLDMGLMGGKNKQNDIFITGGALIKDIPQASTAMVEKNIAAIATFSSDNVEDDVSQPPYLVILPTASAVMQNSLPRYASSVMVDQKAFIESVYSRMGESVTGVDAYSILLSKNSEYIYYRTQNNLTALGGYYTYSALCKRMDIKPAPFNRFDISYASTSFYGDLYEKSPYKGAVPDIISLYLYRNGEKTREYLVTSSANSASKIYHTLYPKHLLASSRSPMDIYLGGISPTIDIKNSSGYTGRLLVFGDHTALAYLPFLCNNFEQVTFVNLLENPQYYSHINPQNYTKILFAYSSESFMNTTIPSRVVFANGGE